MRKIKTKDLKPGQVFSAPVYSEGDNMLVPEMVPLRQKDIDLLNTWAIEFVISDGHKIDIDVNLLSKKTQAEPETLEEVEEAQEIEESAGYTGQDSPIDQNELDDLFSMFNSSVQITPSETSGPAVPAAPEAQGPIRFSISDVRQNSGPYRLYKNLIEKLNYVFSSIKAGVDVQMRAVDSIAEQLFLELKNNPDSFIGFILGGEVSGNELAKSSVNTAILSALTAQEMKIPNHKIHNIVSGALLHDVGMIRLSKGITEKKGGLSDAELEQIKSHPVHSSKIVTKELFGNSEVNFVALQHHERWDGTGYPDRLMGPAIDIGARIVSVADAFEAMVSKKSYRSSMVGYQAIKNLMADNARRFDPSVIIAFTKIMGIYPIGSIVRLNDFSVARVVNLNAEAPLRPVVQMLMDDKGKVYGSRDVVTIDLLAEKKLFIKCAIDPAEYNGTNV